MGQLNVTLHALASLDSLWGRQQGGAIPPSTLTVLAAGPLPGTPRLSGEAAGVSDFSPASDAPAAPPAEKPKRKYKRSKNGRRTSKVPPPKRRKKNGRHKRTTD
jgi:hypothetical protein